MKKRIKKVKEVIITGIAAVVGVVGILSLSLAIRMEQPGKRSSDWC